MTRSTTTQNTTPRSGTTLSARDAFATTTATLINDHHNTALVWAEITGNHFTPLGDQHPDRVINVGIREALMVNVGAGLALTGFTPIMHTIAPFLVERAFEHIKLGFGHHHLPGTFVSCGGSFDYASSGRTHQAPGDVALMRTLPGIRIIVPGHATEVSHALTSTVTTREFAYLRTETTQNPMPILDGLNGLHPITHGTDAVVIAVGSTLGAVLAATADLDVTVLYTAQVKPFDADGLRHALAHTPANIVLVEPYLAGTTASAISAALLHTPHRLLALGTADAELRHYGTPAEHRAAHGLDAAGIRRQVQDFLG